MAKFIPLSFIFFFFLNAGYLQACRCGGQATFCQSAYGQSSGLAIIEILDQGRDTSNLIFAGPYDYFLVKIIERLDSFQIRDTFRIVQGNGADCIVRSIGQIGDSVLLNLETSFKWEDGQEIFGISECGIFYLPIFRDTLHGPIGERINKMHYQDFLMGLADCFATLPSRGISGDLIKVYRQRLYKFKYQLNGIDRETGFEGKYGTGVAFPKAGELNYLRFSKRDELKRGISVYDLYLIQRHILGKQPFTDPYQLLAADVNGSGDITVLDLIQIQRLLLGQIPSVSSRKPWLFIPLNHEFPDPQNPWKDPLPDPIAVNVTRGSVTMRIVVLKIGDVDSSY